VVDERIASKGQHIKEVVGGREGCEEMKVPCTGINQTVTSLAARLR
jgi:hypothetical protein